MPDEQMDKEDITNLLKRTGAHSIEAALEMVYMATKTFLGMGEIFRRGVPARFVGFQKRVCGKQKVKCCVVRYHDGIEFALPVGKLFKGFSILDEKNITTTYIERTKLERGM